MFSVPIKAMILVQILAGSISACSAAAHPACEDPCAVLCLQPWLLLPYHKGNSYGQHSLWSPGEPLIHHHTKALAVVEVLSISSFQRSLFYGA